MKRQSYSLTAALMCSLGCGRMQAVFPSFVFLRIKRGSLSLLEGKWYNYFNRKSNHLLENENVTLLCEIAKHSRSAQPSTTTECCCCSPRARRNIVLSPCCCYGNFFGVLATLLSGTIKNTKRRVPTLIQSVLLNTKLYLKPHHHHLLPALV